MCALPDGDQQPPQRSMRCLWGRPAPHGALRCASHTAYSVPQCGCLPWLAAAAGDGGMADPGRSDRAVILILELACGGVGLVQVGRVEN